MRTVGPRPGTRALLESLRDAGAKLGIISDRGMGDKLLAVIKASNSDLVYARADERGYSLITVTPEQVRCDFRTTANPAGSETGLKIQASFVVTKDRAGVQSL